jgi:hypothetical protein
MRSEAKANTASRVASSAPTVRAALKSLDRNATFVSSKSQR